MPTLSVVIPTYQRNDLLARCLDRLAPGVQTVSPETYEVIVSDDGSKTTAQQMMAEQYPWAKWVAGPKKGPASNRNNAVGNTVADWIVFTDDDCIPDPKWLESFVSAVKPGTNVYEGRTTCDEGVKSPIMHSPINLEGGNLWSCNFMITKKLFIELGGFDENYPYPHMEDIDFRDKIVDSGNAIEFVPSAVIDHPARPLALGIRMGKTHESEVLYNHKHAGRPTGSSALLRNILVHRVRQIQKYPVTRDTAIALWSLAVELAYVATHAAQWERTYSARTQ